MKIKSFFIQESQAYFYALDRICRMVASHGLEGNLFSGSVLAYK